MTYTTMISIARGLILLASLMLIPVLAAPLPHPSNSQSSVGSLDTNTNSLSAGKRYLWIEEKRDGSNPLGTGMVAKMGKEAAEERLKQGLPGYLSWQSVKGDGTDVVPAKRVYNYKHKATRASSSLAATPNPRPSTNPMSIAFLTEETPQKNRKRRRGQESQGVAGAGLECGLR